MSYPHAPYADIAQLGHARLQDAELQLREVTRYAERVAALKHVSRRARLRRRALRDADADVSAALYALREAVRAQSAVVLDVIDDATGSAGDPFCHLYAHPDGRSSVRLRGTTHHGGVVEHVSHTLASEQAAHRWIAERRERDGLRDTPQPRLIELRLGAASEEPDHG